MYLSNKFVVCRRAGYDRYNSGQMGRRLESATVGIFAVQKFTEMAPDGEDRYPSPPEHCHDWRISQGNINYNLQHTWKSVVGE